MNDDGFIELSAKVGDVTKALANVQVELIQMRSAVGRRTSWEGRFDERICTLSTELAQQQRAIGFIHRQVRALQYTLLLFSLPLAALAGYVWKWWQ